MSKEDNYAFKNKKEQIKNTINTLVWQDPQDNNQWAYRESHEEKQSLPYHKDKMKSA